MQNTHRRVLVWFRKEGVAKGLSHRELMDAMEAAFRASRLPVRMSEGATRKVKLSFPTALPQGVASRMEVVEVAVAPGPTMREVCERLAAELPEGLVAFDADWLYSGERVRVTAIAWAVRGVSRAGLEELLGSDSIPAERRGREVDLAKLLAGWSMDDGRLWISIRWTDAGTARPEDFLRAAGLDPAATTIEKTGMTFRTTFGETIQRDDAPDPGK
ncbi:MAG: TIGR03936 family radical SAM-associated protein [Planctomycetota bacterium]